MDEARQNTDAVAILGLGLMGGSLGLALRARGFHGRIAGYARRAEVRAEALRRGAADEMFDRPEAAVRGAGVVVVCVPVLEIPALAATAAPALSPEAAMTDVGSTKVWVADRVRAALGAAAGRFVGSHPIAGSEKQGLDGAVPDLYDRATVVMTPRADGSPEAIERVASLWRLVGARVIRLTPEEHDLRLARTSHLPHLTAAVLAAVAGRGARVEGLGAFCGTGFRDTTRVADGSPEVWHDIVRTNRDAILVEMDAFGERWREAAEALRREDYATLRRVFEEGRSARRALLAGRDVRVGGEGESS